MNESSPQPLSGQRRRRQTAWQHNCPSPYLAPTTESLRWFQARREQWKSRPRRRLEPLPLTGLASSIAATPERTTSREEYLSSVSKKQVTWSPPAVQQQPILSTQAKSIPIVSTPQRAAPADPASPPQPATPPDLSTLPPATPPKSAAATPPDGDNHREKLIAFYQKHNPERVSTVDATLQKYKGQEETMWKKLHSRYNDTFLPATGTGPTCFLTFPRGTVHVQVFGDKAPRCAHNFVELCRTGQYKNVPVHRIVPNFCVQTGDTTVGDGTGGRSVYENSWTDLWGNFPEETRLLRHDATGLVSMANRGNVRENGSQFFFTLRPLPHLNGKHVVFGRVTKGLEHVLAMGKLATDDKQRPVEAFNVIDCGVVTEEGGTGSTLSSTRVSATTATAPVLGGGTKSAFSFAPTTPFGAATSSLSTESVTPEFIQTGGDDCPALPDPEEQHEGTGGGDTPFGTGPAMFRDDGTLIPTSNEDVLLRPADGSHLCREVTRSLSEIEDSN